MTKPSTFVSTTSSDKTFRAFGDEATFHLTGAQTDGRLTAFTSVTPPGQGPPPHYHENEDEWFLLLEGKAEFFLEGEWQEVGVGSMVFAARGSVHTFRNVGDSPLKMLAQAAPAGFEVFFERSAEEFAKDGPPDQESLVQIAGEHGIHFV